MKRGIVGQNRARICQRLAAVMLALLAISTASGQYLQDDRLSCRICHGTNQSATDFCELFQAQVYDSDDKHARAFYLLHESNDPQRKEAKQKLVRQILGFDLLEAFENDRYELLKTPSNDKTPSDDQLRHRVDTVKACLRCHATWPKSADANYAHQSPVPLAVGVSCQACHGPGLNWDLEHRLSPVWRVVTAEAKASLGFYDVRSPVKKAQLCASCHVGDLEQGKFVTHEWYAGGHPPLPSFELANFERQMPMHWKPLSEKKEFTYRHGTFRLDAPGVANAVQHFREKAKIPIAALKSNYIEANFNSPEAEHNLPRSRDAIAGGAAVLEMYVRLVSGVAGQAGENKAAAEGYKTAWPELALYDCMACHHELRSGLGLNERPKRNHTPGRPPLAAWPTVLAKLAAHQAAGFDPAEAHSRWAGIEGQMLQLERAATQRPFGDAQAMSAAGAELAKSIRQLALDAANSRFDENAARKSILFLSEPANYETRDFFAARQAAWAIREHWRDLNPNEAENLIIPGASGPLALELPSGPNRSVMQNLHIWLPAAADYDAAWFREELKAVRARVPNP